MVLCENKSGSSMASLEEPLFVRVHCYIVCEFRSSHSPEFQHKMEAYLAESPSTNDLQDLEVLLVQSHLFHFRGEWFGCGEREK